MREKKNQGFEGKEGRMNKSNKGIEIKVEEKPGT